MHSLPRFHLARRRPRKQWRQTKCEILRNPLIWFWLRVISGHCSGVYVLCRLLCTRVRISNNEWIHYTYSCLRTMTEKRLFIVPFIGARAHVRFLKANPIPFQWSRQLFRYCSSSGFLSFFFATPSASAFCPIVSLGKMLQETRTVCRLPNTRPTV